MSDELKPVLCGCGGEAKVRGNVFSGWYMVICQKCGIETQYFSTKGEAVNAWNVAMIGHRDKLSPTERR